MKPTCDSTLVYRFVVSPLQTADPRSTGFLKDAHALGLSHLRSIQCHSLYFIEGNLSSEEQAVLGEQILSDPVTESFTCQTAATHLESSSFQVDGSMVVETALLPGVTDPVAEQVVRAAGVLGIRGVKRACTGTRFVVQGDALGENDMHTLARRLLANPIIQRYALGEVEPIFPHLAEASGKVDLLPVRDSDTDQLLALSNERRAALDLTEMQAIQAYFQREKREPTDIEFETIAQTWSEHCVHKTFRARIELTNSQGESQVIDNLLKTYLRSATEAIAAPWVLSAFVDNAGIIALDEDYEVSFKVETHNHPSAIEPFGGANTGVGGVIRDVLGVSAKPIAATDVLCFGPQDLPFESLAEGVLHPRRIQSGVVAGVQDYGNKIGIPTVSGGVLYDDGFTSNPLVFCGCVGVAPRGSNPHQIYADDRVIVIGGGTGRDGLRGATFSSMTMDAQTGEVSGASVQIGDPITEKGLIEVILRARDQGLYHAITDCGAGGLSSAVGEMASSIGAEVELKDVRLKYPGLAPWEIWLSEAQERMVLAVPPSSLAQLQAICDTFDVQLTDIGVFEPSGRLVVKYAGNTVLNLENEFLHHGIPQRHLSAAIPAPARIEADLPQALTQIDPAEAILKLLAHPDIASKAHIVRIYDHEVQGGTIVKPLTGADMDAHSDACVLVPAGTAGTRGIVLSNGINPQFGKVDAYHMAFSVVDEAIRNAVATGADPQQIALLDNFCWGDPARPETLGSLAEAARGCRDAALLYRTPFISGKDSLNNEYLGSDGKRHAIPPTLLISAIGIIEDVKAAVTTDLKEAGNEIFLLGSTGVHFGGSHLLMVYPSLTAPLAVVPGIVPEASELYRRLHQAIRKGWVRACHDLAEGGLAVAAAEMCIGGALGLSLEIPSGMDLTTALFSQSNSRLLAEVRPVHAAEFAALMADLPVLRLGKTTQDSRLVFKQHGQDQVNLGLDQLHSAWNSIP